MVRFIALSIGEWFILEWLFSLLADGEHAADSGGSVGAVRVGPLRPAGAAPVLPVRRHGEPLSHLRYPHTAGLSFYSS